MRDENGESDSRFAAIDRELVAVNEFDGWRREARRLLKREVAPESVEWRPLEDGAQMTLPVGGGGDRSSSPTWASPSQARDEGSDSSAETKAPRSADRPSVPRPNGRAANPRVPRRFFPLARRISCHRDPDRWALLYRLLWRLTHGERHLLEVTVDPDSARATAMAKAVKRDTHKMKAFVRFRRTVDGEGRELFLAWHRPDHRIVRLVAPFFVERFNDQRWVIMTPDDSAVWDGQKLAFGPGTPAPSHETDGLEELWRTYYRSIFNPARLKVRAMKAELPVRHWATLPEATLIPALIQGARGAEKAMISAPIHPPAASVFPAEPSLATLAEALPHCRACPLHAEAEQAVFGKGPKDARLVLLGEQPGDLEDRVGRPFVGPAGEVLDRALADAGIDRGSVYLTNTVKHFKFEHRGKWRIHKTPGETEVTACLPWLEAEIEQISPELVVCLGGTAARAVIGRHIRVTRQRGSVLESRLGPPALATVHPASVLRIADPPSRQAAFERFVDDLVAATSWLAA